MLRKLALLAAFIALNAPAFAQINAPTSNGEPLSPADAPCVPFAIGIATGTTEVLVRNSGPGYVSWVMVSTIGAAGAYTRVRDTGSLNNQGVAQDMLGFLVHPTSNTANAPGAAGDEQKNVIYHFRPPARFVNGVTMLKSATDTSAVICTRLYGTSSP